MKALPSITFGQFRCSAGDVTARVSKGRQILSARAVHNHITTVAQAARRCSFAAISRSYKKLTQAQMAGWAVLAEKLKGSVVFGQAAQKTPNSKKKSASSKKNSPNNHSNETHTTNTHPNPNSPNPTGLFP